MILVDSSVWIDFFNGKSTPASMFFKARLGYEIFAIGDLMLTEILQGFTQDKDYRQALKILGSFPIITLGGENLAIKAAENYRKLRKKGVTIRGAVDALIATYCMEHSLPLLYSDRDFDTMAKHLGLQSALKTLN